MGMADVAKEYMAKLFGAPAVAYSVQPSQWVGQQQPAQAQQPTAPTTPYSQTRSGDGNERAQGGKWADRGGIPTVNSPDYWAGQFKPDIGWRDVLKAYGPSIAGALTGNPLMVGLNMARMYKNPTQDPLWQKAASQYLDAIGNPMSLADVIGQINGLYKANIDSRIFASDTARGVLLGLGNPTQWGQASSYGMAPYQFAQAMSGYNYAGIDPTGANTYEMFSSSPTYDSLRSMGYSNTPQSSFLSQYAQMLGTGQLERGGLAQQAIERGVASANARDLSNRWMNDVLTGRTTKTFEDWQKDREKGIGAGSGFGDSTKGDPGLGGNGIDKGNTSGTGCFVAGTAVRLATGEDVPIESVDVGDSVLSYDTEDGHFVEARVEELRRPKSNTLIDIVFNDGSAIRTTPDHPFYTGKAWVALNPELASAHVCNPIPFTTGSKVLSIDGERHVERITILDMPEDIQLYNFKVAGTHTYVANGLVVHNK